MERLRIVWLVDDPKWAFGIRAAKIAKSLPKYDHVIMPVGEINEEPEKNRLVEQADIVVCPFLPWLEALKKLDNVVCGLNSFRAFDFGDTQ